MMQKEFNETENGLENTDIFNYERSGHKLLTAQTVNLLNAAHEVQSRENVQLQISPSITGPLLQVARIQSTSTSILSERFQAYPPVQQEQRMYESSTDFAPSLSS